MKPFYVSLKPFLDACALPRPTHWPQVFPPKADQPLADDGNPNQETYQRLEVEIGFGNGEYLARLAQENPSVNYVGFEEYCERISRTLRKLSRVSDGAKNVRVMRLDARPGFVYLFAPQSIDFVHCLFPPPWPKKSDIKHRHLTTDFLRLVNNRLKTGGGMKVVTDYKRYAAWVMEQIPGSGFEASECVIPARYDTKFERKWVEGGQKEFYEINLTKQQHLLFAPKEDAALNQYALTQFNPDHFEMKDYSSDGISVIFKDYLYDPKRQTALVYVLVHDEHLLQNVRIVIAKSGAKWMVNLAQGAMLMPTAGIAKALELVRDAAESVIPLP